MSRPLYRGLAGGGRSGGDEFSEHGHNAKGFGENGRGSGPAGSGGAARVRKNRSVIFLKAALAVMTILAFVGSLYWAISISSSSHVSIYRGYRRLQEQLVGDLLDISDLALGLSKSKELDFCPPEFENHVPCYYNITADTADAADVDHRDPAYKVISERSCYSLDAVCLILPPREYRIPLRWPSGRDFIWKENVKITGQEFSSGSLTKRMMVEEEQISFRYDSLMVDGVEDYSHQIAEMIGLRNESNFNEAGVRTVLDIGCGFGSFGAHLFSKQLLTLCIANYESTGSQVQITLERGIPAVIASLESKQLPFPFLSFDMIHCARCDIDWETNDGALLIEVNRLLRPGGYFVWTSLLSTHRSIREKENQKKWMAIRDIAGSLCWDLLAQQDETVVWKKTNGKDGCYGARKVGPEVCRRSHDPEISYYQPLNPCIAGTRSSRWIPIEHRLPWPSQAQMGSSELEMHGVRPEDFAEDGVSWNVAIENYWSLLSPLVFSDHPKRPGDEEPQPPFNMLRNVLDMNAKYGGLNAALLDTGRSVWVMNVAPSSGPNYLPLIFDRGFIGIQHDWCEAFPTYPRTYDMVHADGLLSLERQRGQRCSTLDILLEVDRLLRPEGWVIIHDVATLTEAARAVTMQLKWDCRLIDIDSSSNHKLLACQKPFFKKIQ